jgi:hypothetical protein
MDKTFKSLLMRGNTRLIDCGLEFNKIVWRETVYEAKLSRGKAVLKKQTKPCESFIKKLQRIILVIMWPKQISLFPVFLLLL